MKNDVDHDLGVPIDKSNVRPIHDLEVVNECVENEIMPMGTTTVAWILPWSYLNLRPKHFTKVGVIVVNDNDRAAKKNETIIVNDNDNKNRRHPSVARGRVAEQHLRHCHEIVST